jgi:CheY-like chemotaxis protein
MNTVHIWIVEDNNADVLLIELALGRIGMEFAKTIIGDGETAVRMIGTCQEGSLSVPDVLLLDLSLPRIDGKGVLQALKAAPAFANTGVAIFSSSAGEHSDYGDKVRFVYKPSDLDAFLSAVSETIIYLLPPEGRCDRCTAG